MIFLIQRRIGGGSFGTVALVNHGQKQLAMKILEKQHIIKLKEIQHVINECHLLLIYYLNLKIMAIYIFVWNLSGVERFGKEISFKQNNQFRNHIEIRNIFYMNDWI